MLLLILQGLNYLILWLNKGDHFVKHRQLYHPLVAKKLIGFNSLSGDKVTIYIQFIQIILIWNFAVFGAAGFVRPAGRHNILKKHVDRVIVIALTVGKKW